MSITRIAKLDELNELKLRQAKEQYYTLEVRN